MRLTSLHYFLLVLLSISLSACGSGDQRKTEQIPASPQLSPSEVWDKFIEPCQFAIRLEATGCNGIANSLIDQRLNPVGSSPLLSGILSVEAAYSLVFSQNDASGLFHELNTATADLCTLPADSVDYFDELYNQNPYRRDILEKITTSVAARPLQCNVPSPVTINYMTGICTAYLYYVGQSIKMFPEKLSAEDSRIIVLMPLFDELINQRESLKALEQSVPASDVSNYPPMRHLFSILTDLDAIVLPNDSLTESEFVELYNSEEFHRLIESTTKLKNEVIKLDENENT